MIFSNQEEVLEFLATHDSLVFDSVDSFFTVMKSSVKYLPQRRHFIGNLKGYPVIVFLPF